MFSSSRGYSANLGGLEGADATCQALADAAGREGTFRAWLSSKSLSAAQRLTHSSEPYVLGSGTLVANDWRDLVKGALRHAVDETENGAVPFPYVEQTCSYVAFWSGTSVHGDQFGGTCNDWTSTNERDHGLKGITAASDWAWSMKCDDECDGLSTIVCIEQ